MISDLLYRLRALFRRSSMEADMEEELREHLEHQVEKYVEAGMSRDEAKRRAKVKFGGVEQVKEECRDARGVAFIETLVQDVRFAIRQLRKTPVISAMALLSLALGIGANTAIFSLVDSVLLRMLPVQEPEQLVQVKFHSPKATNVRRTYTNPIWEQIRDRQDVFSGVFAWSPDNFDLANGGEAQYVRGSYVSGGYFNTLGVRPAIGRLFTSADDRRGCNGAVVLGYGFWQQHYEGAEGAIGSLLRLNGHRFPVIGVAQRGFFGTNLGDRFDVAIPICAQAIMAGKDSWLDQRSTWWLLVMGRLNPGISSEQAEARLNVLAPQIFDASVPLNWPPAAQRKFRTYTFVDVPAASGVAGFLGDLRDQYERPLEVLMAVVGLVLLIACANIASLMLARGSARRREIAMRASLGASRSRLIRQGLTESLVLAGAGALLGTLFSRWGSALLVRYVSTGQSRVSLDLSLDTRVLVFTVGIAILTAMLFGVWPALRATRVSLADAIKGGGAQPAESRFRFRSRRWIVALQMALSLVLLIGTGLFVRTFRNLVTLNPGFDRSHVLLVNMNVHNAGVPPSARASYYTTVLDRLKALPGAASVSQVWFTPFSGMEWNQDVKVDGYQPSAGEEPLVYFNWITDAYFTTLRTPLLAGRTFNSGDTATSPRVAIVNETMARRFFPKTNAIGKYFRFPESGSAERPFEIVGIVADSKYESLRETIYPFAYLPLSQIDFTSGNDGLDLSSFMIRTTVNPTSLIPSMREAIGAINKTATLQFGTLAEQVDDSLVEEHLLAVLSGFFGVLALLMTAIGLYGVMAYTVTQRTKEIGIRVALGARYSSILRLVMLDIALLLGSGVVVGMVVAAWATRFVQHLLFGMGPQDAETMMLAGAALMLVALLASYLPARRAMRVDPMVALRNE